MIDNRVAYGRIMPLGQTFYMLQSLFQSFMITAEKPKLALIITIFSSSNNIILDYFFIAVFKWGVACAALATIVGQFIGGTVPTIYFFRENSSLLHLSHLVHTPFDLRILGKGCINGSSEVRACTSQHLRFLHQLGGEALRHDADRLQDADKLL